MGFGFGDGFNKGTSTRAGMRARNRGAAPARTIFDTRQTAHVWAQQNQAYGSNGKATLYFEGPTLYSYGHHYPLASFTAATKGRERGKPAAVLFNRNSYSVTTSRHMRYAENAIRNGSLPTFAVPHPEASSEYEHADNFKRLLKSYTDSIAASEAPRIKAARRHLHLAAAPPALECATAYRDLFLSRHKYRVPTLPATLERELAELSHRALVDEHRKAIRDTKRKPKRGWGYTNRLSARAHGYKSIMHTAHAANKAARALGLPVGAIIALDWRRMANLYKAAHAAAERMRAHPDPVRYDHNATRRPITAQMEGTYTSTHYRQAGYGIFNRFANSFKTDSEVGAERAAEDARNAQWEAERAERRRVYALSIEDKIRAFREHGTLTDGLTSAPVMLAVRGDTVRTSWGAEFPVAHAALAWRAVRRTVASGVPWHKNGERVRVGVFQLDSIDAAGNVKAGCHDVTYDEIESCAKALGLTT